MSVSRNASTGQASLLVRERLLGRVVQGLVSSTAAIVAYLPARPWAGGVTVALLTVILVNKLNALVTAGSQSHPK